MKDDLIEALARERFDCTVRRLIPHWTWETAPEDYRKAAIGSVRRDELPLIVEFVAEWLGRVCAITPDGAGSTEPARKRWRETMR